jgi:hypothetical protein
MMQQIELREVPNLEGYFAGSDGQIYSKKNGMKPLTGLIGARKIGMKGYRTACINRKTYYIHHLIARAYLPPKPFSSAILRHLDGDSLNNAVKNLAWGSFGDDREDQKRCGTSIDGSHCGTSKLKPAQVDEILATPNSYSVCRTLAKMFNVSHSTISRIRLRQTWKIIQ